MNDKTPEQPKLCPLLVAANISGGGQYLPSQTYCRKEQCAWWHKHTGTVPYSSETYDWSSCAILAIAGALPKQL